MREPRSAPGPDGFSGKVASPFAMDRARYMHPPPVKATVRVAEPIQWKWGFYCSLFKSWDASKHARYGSILVSSHFGKRHRSIIREGTTPALEAVAGARQYGSLLPGRGTEFGAPELRLPQQLAE
eukprot:471092-Pyramimonas_sp.AAC.1